ncbi:hypothetical protein ACMHYO_20915 [Allopusillimonas ginsengisoli]|uniref:hypothetical protein n=1 Tax=Allopusillimonas ginsengisoli TaxID=453575 RepID=UPI0039C17181
MLLVGTVIERKVCFLERYSIPAPITGGLIDAPIAQFLIRRHKLQSTAESASETHKFIEISVITSRDGLSVPMHPATGKVRGGLTVKGAADTDPQEN